MTIQEKRSQLVTSNYFDLFQAIESKVQALQDRIDNCINFADLYECDMKGKSLIAEWKRALKEFKDIDGILPDDKQKVEAVINAVQSLIEKCGI